MASYPSAPLRIDRPFWLKPGHVFTAERIAHLGHWVTVAVGVMLMLSQYIHAPHRLANGDWAWTPPHFHFEFGHLETWLGVVLVLFTAINSGVVGRAVRWRHQSALLPTWNEAVRSEPLPDIMLRYVALGSGDLDALLTFLEPAFPQRWYLPRPRADRKDLLTKLVRTCPRAIVLMIRTKGKRPTLVGCSVIAPLASEAYFDYLNGRADNWRFESKDFADRSQFVLSNYLFSYRKRYRVLLRDLFIQHLAAVGPADDSGVAVIAPRKSAIGQQNMERVGGRHVGESMQRFPLYELDLRNEGALNDIAKSTARALHEYVREPRVVLQVP
jgi:hypothetical protein